LSGIDQKGASGSWESTNYGESLQLSWASHGDVAFEALDLPQRVPMFVDVVSVRDTETAFRLATRRKPFRLRKLCSTPGTYRFNVVAVGDNVAPVRVSLIFTWRGKWDEFEVTSG
jgi:hypothetical protein